jgi:hypothetical protein
MTTMALADDDDVTGMALTPGRLIIALASELDAEAFFSCI